jgi:hypothetical protein
MIVLHFLVALQLLGLAGYASLRLADALAIGPRAVARLGRGLVLLVPVLAALAVVVDGPGPSLAPARVHHAARAPGEVVLSVATPTTTLLDVQTTPGRIDLAAAVGLVVVGLALGRAGLEIVRVRRRLAGTMAWRRIGRVELRLAPRGTFAVWWFGRRIVAIDRDLVATPDALGLALRHELQHHRAGDPLAAWGLLALRAASVYSPWIEAWARLQEAAEELACDAAVVARPGVSRSAYAYALLDAASRGEPSPLVTGFVPAPGPLLHRRISMLTDPRPSLNHRLPAALVAVALLMGGTAFASGLVVDDARIDDATLEQAARAAQDDAFPISLSAPVAARVRSLAGSERGRAYVRASISRSEATYGVMVDDALAAYGLPPQLAAVPLVESGYDNLPAHRNPVGAAGLWQFMPETARMYGLRVDATVDERLDPARATDAACRLLRDLRARHGDWGLALAAYNQGDQAVITAVAAEGTRDVGALIEAGALNDYAAQVLAAAMVLEQPALLD